MMIHPLIRDSHVAGPVPRLARLCRWRQELFPNSALATVQCGDGGLPPKSESLWTSGRASVDEGRCHAHEPAIASKNLLPAGRGCHTATLYRRRTTAHCLSQELARHACPATLLFE